MNSINEDEIISIECVGEQDTVDILVSDDNLFMANNILTHNSGYDTEKPGLESISESIGLAATADFIGIITQSDEDRELNVTRLNIAKNRFGPNYGTTLLRIDYSTLSIVEDDSLQNMDDLTDSVRTLQSLSR